MKIVSLEYQDTVVLTCFTLLAFRLVSCKIDGRLTILLDGMTVELEVRPSSTKNHVIVTQTIHIQGVK